MFTIANYDYECTKKCKCKDHGKEITAALTKRSIEDESLAAFIAKTCRNFSEITDDLGRTALHMSSSMDRYCVTEWLLNYGASMSAKDQESGSSSLHRAVYYGCIDCAVLLMRYGANVDQVDDDHRIPLQHVCKLQDLDINKRVPSCNEILIWGSNKNYNLGTGNDQSCNTPQSLQYFRKENISIESVAISRFHSLFLDKKGMVYAVGHGKGGRLGTGSENSLTTPKRLRIPVKESDEKVIGISCSKNHSLVLTNRSAVYSCGLNADQQLGIKPAPESLTSFKEITSFSQYGTTDLHSVIARDHYSVAYSSKELFVWGANHGQFGVSQTIPHILLPRLIPIPAKTIQFVEANDSALACYTSDKQVFLFYNHKVKTFKSPTLESIKSICLCGGDNRKPAKDASEPTLKILILTSTDTLFVWYEDSQKFLRCSFPHIRFLEIDKLIYNNNELMILSHGDVYLGKSVKVPIHNIIEDNSTAWHACFYNKREICSDQKIRIDLKRVPNIDRAVDIFCDNDFESFAVLQESSRKYFTLPHLLAEEYTFKKLLNEASESDSIHDVAIHVDNEVFYVHKFIVFSRSSGLMKLIEKYQDKDIYLNFNGLTGKMFEIIIKHIYTNYFVVEEDLDDILQSLGPSFKGDIWSGCNLLLKFAEKFEIADLASYLKSFLQKNQKPLEKSKFRFNRLKRTSFPNLYDVTIKCADNRTLQAHKCVLVTRLEYFNMMFNHSWSESNTISLTTIPYEYMEPIINFLYSADVDHFRKQNYTESFLYNMIVICDQFFINRLRKVCEILVLEKISIRKCGEMLEFACAFNCQVLKKGCLQFICQNLSRVLTQRSLDCCEPYALHEINASYRRMFQNIFDFRLITPYSEAISDEMLRHFIRDFKIDLEHKAEEDPTKSKSRTKVKTSKLAQSRRNYEREAISSMKELSFDTAHDHIDTDKSKKSDIAKEAEKVSEKIHSQAESWMKVNDKKEVKKKSIIAAVNTNYILKDEEKPKETFISLNESLKLTEKTPTKVTNITTEKVDAHHASRPIFNLGDFTPLITEKMSQKQRKRLSSESKSEPKLITPTKPVPIPQSPNAWGVASSSSIEQSSFADIMKSPSSGPGIWGESIDKSPKSLEKLKTPPAIKKTPTKQSLPSSSNDNRSLTSIIQDERKQKEYFEKMRTKSLVLTQIEETAISQLKEFYNVDNVFDESITVDRKSVPTTINFAVWQRN